MITMKTFEKINANIKTSYSVFNSTGKFVDSFTVDYLDEDVERMRKAIKHKTELIEIGAKIETINNYDGALMVSVKIK